VDWWFILRKMVALIQDFRTQRIFLSFYLFSFFSATKRLANALIYD
jgi:hypothetical protein